MIVCYYMEKISFHFDRKFIALKIKYAKLQFLLLAFIINFICPLPIVAEEAIPYYWFPKTEAILLQKHIPFRIRFLTTDDFPPFNFTDGNGRLLGFNIDLSRAICDELSISCTIQVRPFDTLIKALQQEKGDAIISGLSINRKTREQLDFTNIYLSIPARFAVHIPNSSAIIEPETVKGKTIGVLQKSAHITYLNSFFSKAKIIPFTNKSSLLMALKKKQVNFIFSDALTLSLWMNSGNAEKCCQFVEGAYTEKAFFRNDLAIATRKGDEKLKKAINSAMYKIVEKGIFTDIYLRYFPLGLY